MSVRVMAIATATPPGRLSQAQSIGLARALSPRSIPEGLIETLHRRTGIRERAAAIVDPVSGEQTLYSVNDGPQGPTTSARMAAYGAYSAQLGRAAGLEALAKANVAAKRITHIITASCTGFDAPGIDQKLIWELGLDPRVSRTHIGFMGCHAALNSLAVARAIAATDPEAIVLVCCVEICSVHMHFSERVDQLIANALFADGAAAAVIGQSGDVSCPELKRCAARLFPDSVNSMSWRVGDHGFEMTLGTDVPQQLARAVPAWIDFVLDQCELKRGQMGGWAIHPGGPRIVEGLAAALELPREATSESLAVLHQRGNMSSPTVLFILEELRRTGRPLPWVAMAFGPGLAAEAVVLG